MSHKVFLWIYQEQATSRFNIHPTFLTSAEAHDMFKGHYYYRRFVSQDFNGIEPL